MKFNSRPLFLYLCALIAITMVAVARAQNEGADKVEEGDDKVEVEMSRLSPKEKQSLNKGVNLLLDSMFLRVRVTKSRNGAEKFTVLWREGGEGLGGSARVGAFVADAGDKAGSYAKSVQLAKANPLALGEWSAPISFGRILGSVKYWRYPTVEVSEIFADKQRAKAMPPGGATVEFEFSSPKGVFKTFEEPSPHGLRRSFVLATHLLKQGLYRQGYHLKPNGSPIFDPKFYSEFIAQLQPVSAYARARYERLLKEYSLNDPLPQRFGIIGNIQGYGASGLGVRYGDPEIVRTEMKTLRLLGFNGHKIGNSIYGRTGDLVKDEKLSSQEGLDRVYWGGPGAGDPMDFFRGKKEIAPSPFNPQLKEYMAAAVDSELKEFERVEAKDRWGLWGDEIFVAMREGLEDAVGANEEFRDFLKLHDVQPAQVGAASWAEVKLRPLVVRDAKDKVVYVPRPATTEERLLQYYSLRFASYATGRMYADAAQKFEENGVLLYTMNNPKPSWGGSLFDWHDFYAAKPNRALVFETSNRDPRVWQWESYLSDIMRGIAQDTGWPQGVLIKPHRGAPKQRMLTTVARGARAFEWYTYGPDYAKGDSFSQNPKLLDAVAQANRFLGKSEEYLYEAKWARPAEVAFVYPRASYMWENLNGDKGNKFEDAKWVYLALNHAHIPVDVLGSDQLLQRDFSHYKAIYIVGANLEKAAAIKIKNWVKNGGMLWTDANGLSRDEADDPLDVMAEVLGLGERNLEIWGDAPSYGSVRLGKLTEGAVPEYSSLRATATAQQAMPFFAESKPTPDLRAHVGREALDVKAGEVLATFADGKPAISRHRFGQGEAVVVGFYAGLAYSAKMRRPDYDMATDYDVAFRDIIAAPARSRNVYRPVIPQSPLVEAVLLEKDGQRSVALMNWAYRANGGLLPLDNLHVALPDVGPFTTVKSVVHGQLPVEGVGGDRYVVVPRIAEIDVLALH